MVSEGTPSVNVACMQLLQSQAGAYFFTSDDRTIYEVAELSLDTLHPIQEWK